MVLLSPTTAIAQSCPDILSKIETLASREFGSAFADVLLSTNSLNQTSNTSALYQACSAANQLMLRDCVQSTENLQQRVKQANAARNKALNFERTVEGVRNEHLNICKPYLTRNSFENNEKILNSTLKEVDKMVSDAEDAVNKLRQQMQFSQRLKSRTAAITNDLISGRDYIRSTWRPVSAKSNLRSTVAHYRSTYFKQPSRDWSLQPKARQVFSGNRNFLSLDVSLDKVRLLLNVNYADEARDVKLNVDILSVNIVPEVSGSQIVLNFECEDDCVEYKLLRSRQPFNDNAISLAVPDPQGLLLMVIAIQDYVFEKAIDSCLQGDAEYCSIVANTYRKGWAAPQNQILANAFDLRANSEIAFKQTASSEGAPIWLRISDQYWSTASSTSLVGITLTESSIQEIERAAREGDARAAIVASLYWSNNFFSPRDDEKYVEYNRIAHKLGEPKGTYGLGMANKDGIGSVKQSDQLAFEFFETGCEKQEPNSCNELGLFYEKGRATSLDVKKAYEYYEKTCSLGLGVGCGNLARAYQDGRGVPQSLPEAVRLDTEACAMGYAASCYNAGLAYTEGRGVRKSDLNASKNYQQGCNLDDGPSCTSFGAYVSLGRAVRYSRSDAYSFYEKACRLEDAFGCFLYGKATSEEMVDGVELEAAPLFLEKGCEGGYAESCTYLARLYQTGKGIPRSNVRARTYFEKGCAGNDKAACVAINKN